MTRGVRGLGLMFKNAHCLVPCSGPWTGLKITTPPFRTSCEKRGYGRGSCMRNLKGNRAVDEAVFETVHNVVGDAVHRAVNEAVCDVVCDVVFWPVYRAVGDAATWAMFDSGHPALQAFLRAADVKTGVVRTT